MAIVNANSQVGIGCIISVGAVVDHDVILGDCAHVNAGAIVKDGGKVESEGKLEAREVVLGYREAVVKPAMKPTDSNSDFAKEYREEIGKDVSFF